MDALPQASCGGDGNCSPNRSGESLFQAKALKRNAVSDVSDFVTLRRLHPCHGGIKSLPHALS
ncbi:hypothetical protein F9K88_18645 [Brucella intermedia]|nr:hypothetical protein F9K88_18645 [Brucella intermedia]KAB2717872.1 hypothetical protein F9K73_17055 [Brucella intermedia]PJT20668.1 hypothetical protein CN884_17060 [Ochrobactrum sp. 30A/1000/2015]PJT40009.1 hypothetical protein CN883_00290 [Ochrobactrum sp. 27A/999/2015]PJT43429.1 hypothetical protein CN882_10890 [Ochrobactrum sp. 23A/997/2015]